MSTDSEPQITRLLKPSEAMVLLSVRKTSFWKLVREKAIPAPVKIGGLTRWRSSDIEQMIKTLPN